MRTGDLITLGVLGAFTLIALRPPRRPRLLSRAAYLMGLSVNEIPHLAIGVPFTLATVDVVASGHLDPTWRSLLPAAGALAIGAGIVVLARRGAMAWPAVDDAVRRAGLDPPPRPRWWTWRTLLTPIPARPRSVVRIADLRYGSHRRHRLDVYHRRDRPSGGPVLVYLHGGGYSSGGKHHEGRALLHRLAARGWVCVSATYRLRPSAGFEDHLADAHDAVAWTRAHAATYGGDPGRLVVAGSSAGAHLTSLLALDGTTGLAAAVCLYGHYGRYYGRTPAERVTSTPLALPATDAPPFLIAHGSHDTWTPIEGARALAERLRAGSPSPVVAIELPGGQHGFDYWRSWRCSAVLAGIDRLVAPLEHTPPTPASSAGPTDPGTTTGLTTAGPPGTSRRHP